MNNRKQILDDMRKHGVKMGWAKPIQEKTNKQVYKPEPETKSTQVEEPELPVSVNAPKSFITGKKEDKDTIIPQLHIVSDIKSTHDLGCEVQHTGKCNCGFKKPELSQEDRDLKERLNSIPF